MPRIPDRNILALDLGTTCGFAATKSSRLYSGHWTNPVSHAESPGAYFDAFARWLPELKQWHQPEIVVWEMLFLPRSNDWAMAYGGLLALVRRWAFRQQIGQAFVHVPTLKKHATGDGKAPKDAMVAAMRKRWGLPNLTSMDEADALAVLAWAGENLK